LNSNKSLFANIDWLTFWVYVVLLCFGWLNIYSSEYNEEQHKLIEFSKNHGKQLIWIGICVFLIVLILLMDFRIWHTLAYVLYAFAIGLLLITLVKGKVVNAAQGWIQIGGFQLQPVEIAKFATAMALARYISQHGFDIKKLKQQAGAWGLIFLPIALVLAQNDTGSAMVFLSLVFVLFRIGLNPLFIIIPVWLGVISLSVMIAGKYFVLIGLGIIAAVLWLILRKVRKLVFLGLGILVLSAGFSYGVDFGIHHVLKPYQRERIDVLIGKVEDKKGAGYNVHQSLIAIGSGGVMGKGFLKGTQTKFNFVPEQSTDFIFCTVGEEYGFAGSAIVILLYVLLFYRLIRIAERQKFSFNSYYAYGVLAILFFHFAINIGMALGLFPVIGIPLPYFSYGGSSLIGFTIMLFILLKLDAANREY
jgi:rod shape determining protein RodA